MEPLSVKLYVSLNICFWCSKELSHQEGSFEYSQHIPLKPNHYKDFYGLQCTEPTPLALNNFQILFSNSKNFTLVVENSMDYSFSCKSLSRRSHGGLWIMLHFQNSTQNSSLFLSYFKRSEGHIFNFSIFC